MTKHLPFGIDGERLRPLTTQQAPPVAGRSIDRDFTCMKHKPVRSDRCRGMLACACENFPAVTCSTGHDSSVAVQEGLTHSAVLGIRVDAQVRMRVIRRVWVQVLEPILPNPKPGYDQLLSQDLSLHRIIADFPLLPDFALFA